MNKKYLRNTKTISPLGIRMKPHLEDCDIILYQINDDDIYDIPPWELTSPSNNFKIHCTPKSETLESDKKQRFYEVKDFYESMQFGSVYTDGSTSDDYVSASAVSSVDILKVKLPVRLGYCFTPYQRLWLYNGAPLVAFYDTLGIRRTYSRLKPRRPHGGKSSCTDFNFYS